MVCELTLNIATVGCPSFFVKEAFAVEVWISGFAVINHLSLFSSLTALYKAWHLTPKTPGLTQRHKRRPWGRGRERGEKKQQIRRDICLFYFFSFFFIYLFLFFKEATEQIVTVIGIDLTEEDRTEFCSLLCVGCADKVDLRWWEKKGRHGDVWGSKMGLIPSVLGLPTYPSCMQF